jgi:hypothetical protein
MMACVLYGRRLFLPVRLARAIDWVLYFGYKLVEYLTSCEMLDIPLPSMIWLYGVPGV